MRHQVATGFHVFHMPISHYGNPASGGITYRQFSPCTLVAVGVCRLNNGKRASVVDASRRGTGTGATSVVDEESELETS